MNIKLPAKLTVGRLRKEYAKARRKYGGVFHLKKHRGRWYLIKWSKENE